MVDREIQPVVEAVERAAQSGVFSRSGRHAALLRFLAALPPGIDPKETLVGHEFFQRPADYDPKVDPVVRVEVRRLRERLQLYYEVEGSGDPWRIEIPRGGYAVVATPAGNPKKPEEPQEVPATAVEAGVAAIALPIRANSRRVALLAGCALAFVAGLAWLAWKPARISSIVVLPLTATVNGEREAAAAAGLSREIAGELSRIAGLRIVGPEAAVRAQSLDRNPTSVARRLDVEGILSGAVRVENGQLRLQVQLSRAKDQSVIWARTLQRDMVDPFALENELASSVASFIHSDLLHRPANTRPVVAEALFEYQLGRVLLDRHSELSLRQAIGKFRRATEIDPRFSSAWSARADALAIFPDYGVPEDGWAQEARTAGRKALELDENNADAWAALGWTEFSSDLHAAAAVRLLTRAAELNPNLIKAQSRLAMVLLSQRRFREAEQRLRTALRLDALSPMVRVNLAEVHYYESDFAKEEPELRAALELNPGLAVGQVMLANMLSRVKRCGEAVPLAKRIVENVDGVGWRPSMAGVLARCGDMSLVRELYRPDSPVEAREQVAEYFDDWPLALQFVEHMQRTQPAFLSQFMIGPDGAHYSQYPPIRALFERTARRVQEPE